MNCDRCEAFKHCQGEKLTYANKKGCCFGKWENWCARACPIVDLCVMRDKAGEAVYIEEEADEVSGLPCNGELQRA